MSLISYLPFFAILLVFIIGTIHFYRLTHGSTKLLTGFRAKKLLTNNEVDFYKKLKSACGDKFVVFTQVSLGALLDTKLAPTHPKYWAVRATFSSKILDFVICDSNTLAPLVIVELDDVMHNFDKDKVRDSFTAMGGFRTIRFWSRNKPTVEQLREQLLANISGV